jgi:hypothetical protein
MLLNRLNFKTGFNPTPEMDASHFLANPNGIGIIQPKVARNELPWVNGEEIHNPERVEWIIPRRWDATLSGLVFHPATTQGRPAEPGQPWAE